MRSSAFSSRLSYSSTAESTWEQFTLKTNALNLLFAASAALLATVALVPLVRRLALRFGALDQPGGRHIHTQPTPRLGGIAVAGSFFLIVALTLLIAPKQLQFVDEQFAGIDRNLMGVLLGALVLVATGMYDDLRGLAPWPKLGLQLCAALLVVFFGVQIHWLSNPLGGLDIIIGSWSYLLVPAWLLLTINAMNWSDGVDGLASGISVIASLILLALSLDPSVNQPATAYLAAIVAGAALGFLPYNWHPAKIFLGDSGSLFLGFMIGVFAIISGAKLATAALVLGLPILDAVWVIGRRFLAGQSPMQGDSKHLHHRFLAAGFSVRATVLIFYTIAASFGILALSADTSQKVQALIALVVLVTVGGLVLIRMHQRKAQ